MRSKRPNRELTNDKVQLNLINQGGLLHEFLHKLERGIRAVEHNSAKLQNIRAALAADAGDKVCSRLYRCCGRGWERILSHMRSGDALCRLKLFASTRKLCLLRQTLPRAQMLQHSMVLPLWTRSHTLTTGHTQPSLVSSHLRPLLVTAKVYARVCTSWWLKITMLLPKRIRTWSRACKPESR